MKRFFANRWVYGSLSVLCIILAIWCLFCQKPPDSYYEMSWWSFPLYATKFLSPPALAAFLVPSVRHETKFGPQIVGMLCSFWAVAPVLFGGLDGLTWWNLLLFVLGGLLGALVFLGAIAQAIRFKNSPAS